MSPKMKERKELKTGSKRVNKADIQNALVETDRKVG